MAAGAGLLMGGLVGLIWFHGIKSFWPNGDGDKIVYNLKDNHNKVYLLCYPDLEWEEDPLRETNSKTNV